MPSLPQKAHDDFVSRYTGAVAQPDEIKSEVIKLSNAFTDIDNGYLIVLVDRLIDNGFTVQRVKDAINHAIDTIHYRRPSIAEIISFDKKAKVYTYDEVMAKCQPGQSFFDKVERVEIAGKIRFIEK